MRDKDVPRWQVDPVCERGPEGRSAVVVERMDMRKLIFGALALLIGIIALSAASAAQDLKTFSKKGSFDDVKLDLSDAITKRGFVIDFTGNLGRMLERTGKDVGSTKPLYKNAEYMTFCSAQLSRQMMEADVGNAGYCPFVMFVYENAGKPGEVIIGYRRMPSTGNPASRKAFGDINALMETIAKEAAK